MALFGLALPQRVWYRLTQGLGALLAGVPANRDATLEAILTPEQIAAFVQLSSHDQAHLLRVLELVTASTPSPSMDLRVAAVLHDIGKATPQAHVRLPDRILRVVLGRLTPALWARLARLPAQGWRTGLALAEHHPQLGADKAAAMNCSPRTCWLIALHADRSLPDDDDLRRLVASDHAAR